MKAKLHLENLIYTQQEIDEEGAEFWDKKIKNNEEIDEINVKYCVHTKKYYTTNGHHKSYSLFFLNNIKTGICNIESCKHLDFTHSKLKSPCSIKEEYNSFNGTIHDLKVMTQKDYEKLEQERL